MNWRHKIGLYFTRTIFALRARVITPTKEELGQAKKAEEYVKKVLEQAGFMVQYKGLGAGTDQVFSDEEYEKILSKEETLLPDLMVSESGKVIAWVEVTSTKKWSFRASRHFPVDWYKVEMVRVKEPYFIAFLLYQEPEPFYWRSMKGVNHYRKFSGPVAMPSGKREWHTYYETDKWSWNLGAQGLIKELKCLRKSGKSGHQGVHLARVID